MKLSNINEINFEKLYKKQKAKSDFKNKTCSDWDNKAEELNKKTHSGEYHDFILSKVDVKNANTMLDIGCGPGAFALKFAKKLKKVYALDFSPKMLNLVEKNAKEQNIKNIFCIKHDIEQSFKDIPKADIILASRCMEVKNIKKVLKNLDKQANKAVYLTYKVGGSFLSDKVLSVLKKDIIPKPDYIYLVNILYNLNIKVNVEFLNLKSNFSHDSEDEYVKAVCWSIGELSKNEEINLRKYYQKCLKNSKIPAYRNDDWVLLSWEK